jgi:hypothetical protein
VTWSSRRSAIVEQWRNLRNPNQWQVTAETARLLDHWRNHEFSSVRPFFCQVEAVETAIWLTEVASNSKNGQRILAHLAAANRDANPELMRLALKLLPTRVQTHISGSTEVRACHEQVRYHSDQM